MHLATGVFCRSKDAWIWNKSFCRKEGLFPAINPHQDKFSLVPAWWWMTLSRLAVWIGFRWATKSADAYLKLINNKSKSLPLHYSSLTVLLTELFPFLHREHQPIFTWNVPLVSLIFLKICLVFPILLFSSISLHWSLRKVFLSLLAILWNSAFRCLYLSFSPLLFASTKSGRQPHYVYWIFTPSQALGYVLSGIISFNPFSSTMM